MPLFIGFTGPRESGKSNLIRRLLNLDLIAQQDYQVGMQIFRHQIDKENYCLLDCNAQDQVVTPNLEVNYLAAAAIIVYVIDLSNPNIAATQKHINALRISLPNAQLVLVGNKADLSKSQTRTDQWKAYAESVGLDFFALSVLENTQITSFSQWLFDSASNAPIPFHLLSDLAKWQTLKAQLPPGLSPQLDLILQQIDQIPSQSIKNQLIESLHAFSLLRLSKPQEATDQLLKECTQILINKKTQQRDHLLKLIASFALATVVCTAIMLCGLSIGLLLSGFIGPLALMPACAGAFVGLCIGLPIAADIGYRSYQKLNFFFQPTLLPMLTELTKACPGANP